MPFLLRDAGCVFTHPLSLAKGAFQSIPPCCTSYPCLKAPGPPAALFVCSPQSPAVQLHPTPWPYPGSSVAHVSLVTVQGVAPWQRQHRCWDKRQ